MIPKSLSSTPIGDGDRFTAFAKPASAGEGRPDKIMREKKVPLTPSGILILTVINIFASLEAGKICLGYPILWEKAEA
jgi:hypothetical protein